MKKFTLVALMAALSLTMYACGGGGSKSTNPNDAAEEFQNPTGTLSSSNAKEVSNASLKAYNANSTTSAANTLKANNTTLDPKYFPATSAIFSAADIQACTTTSGNSTTVDWGCIGDADSECDGDGTTVNNSNDGDGYYTIEYNNFSYNCTGDEDFDFSCDGTASYSTEAENIGVYCADITCEFNDFTTTFDGCVNLEGHYLVRADGDSYVLETISTDGSCESLTLTIRDNNSTETITCTVSESNQGCSTLSDVVAVTSCTIN